MEILDNMETAIEKPREELSPYAPKIAIMHIDPDKIKDVIGPGGKMINQIIAECDNVKIDIDDDGQVVIYHQDQAAIDKAKEKIAEIVREAKVGERSMKAKLSGSRISGRSSTCSVTRMACCTFQHFP